MSVNRIALHALLALAMLLSSGCALFQNREPVDVSVVGIEPLAGEGLEFRMLVKLRIMNPNDTALDYNGVSVQMDIQDKRFASGVSDATGSVPRFGETIIKVPMSISAFRMARQAVDAMTSDYRGKLAYELTGKLGGSMFNSARFKSQGELTLPAEFFADDKN